MSKYDEIRKIKESGGAVVILIPEGRDANWLRSQILSYASRWQISVRIKAYDGAVVVTEREAYKQPTFAELRDMEAGDVWSMEFGTDFVPENFRNSISSKRRGIKQYATSIKRIVSGFDVTVRCVR